MRTCLPNYQIVTYLVVHCSCSAVKLNDCVTSPASTWCCDCCLSVGLRKSPLFVSQMSKTMLYLLTYCTCIRICYKNWWSSAGRGQFLLLSYLLAARNNLSCPRLSGRKIGWYRFIMHCVCHQQLSVVISAVFDDNITGHKTSGVI